MRKLLLLALLACGEEADPVRPDTCSPADDCTRSRELAAWQCEFLHACDPAYSGKELNNEELLKCWDTELGKLCTSGDATSVCALENFARQTYEQCLSNWGVDFVDTCESPLACVP